VQALDIVTPDSLSANTTECATNERKGHLCDQDRLPSSPVLIMVCLGNVNQFAEYANIRYEIERYMGDTAVSTRYQ
jgi:hypothetical protein